MKEPEKNESESNYNDSEPLSDLHYVFFDYLSSESGNKLASRIITLIEEIKKSTIDKNAIIAEKNVDYIHKFNTRFQTLQGIVYVSVVIASSTLAYLDKFTPTIGVLFGTIVGYFLGRNPKD
jgi:hypothetical protein